MVTEDTYHGTNMNVLTPDKFLTAKTLSSHNTLSYDADIIHFCAPVVHPHTGETIMNCKKLANDPVMKKVWTKALEKEFGSFAQGGKLTNTPGTKMLLILNHNA